MYYLENDDKKISLHMLSEDNFLFPLKILNPQVWNPDQNQLYLFSEFKDFPPQGHGCGASHIRVEDALASATQAGDGWSPRFLSLI